MMFWPRLRQRLLAARMARSMVDPQPPKPARRWQHKNHPVYLMVSLFLLVLLQPAFHGRFLASMMLSVLFSLVFVTSVLSMFRSRRLLIALCCLGVPWILLKWLSGLLW
jgi:hypothetical protein